MSYARLNLDDALLPALEPGAWRWDVSRDALTGTPRLAEIFGLDTDQLASGVPLKDILDQIHQDDREQINLAISNSITFPGEYFATYRVVVHGRVKWLQACGRYFAETKVQPGLHVGVALDITAFKQMDGFGGQAHLSYQLDMIAQHALKAHELASAAGLISVTNITRPLLHQVGVLIGSAITEQENQMDKK